ncbi:hypothetical protein BH11BAC2_BH11BAC2_04560 [soil metagenome]
MLRYALILLVAVSAISLSSCKKTTPCEAVITVTDTLGRPLPGAHVVLRQDSVVNPQTGVRADIFDEAYTSGQGEVYFSFKNEAVLNIEVTYSTKFIKDYIRLEQSATVRKTVIVK